jgi:hypothetical protein
VLSDFCSRNGGVECLTDREKYILVKRETNMKGQAQKRMLRSLEKSG